MVKMQQNNSSPKQDAIIIARGKAVQKNHLCLTDMSGRIVA